MFKSFRSMAICLILPGLLACFNATAAQSQTDAPPSALSRQLSRMQLAVTGNPVITASVSGTNYLGTNITQKPTTTAGVLVTLGYTRSKWVGFELNYAYARYNERYTCLASSPNCVQSVQNAITPCNNPNSPPSPNTVCPAYVNGGAQFDPAEYSLGYVVHPGKLFGTDPYVSAGAGSLAFRPTRYGGQGLPEQARAVYYYTAGVEKTFFSSHFGLRAQMRETFFKAPDQLTNYLVINKHTTTFEPGFGFFLRF